MNILLVVSCVQDQGFTTTTMTPPRERSGSPSNTLTGWYVQGYGFSSEGIYHVSKIKTCSLGGYVVSKCTHMHAWKHAHTQYL